MTQSVRRVFYRLDGRGASSSTPRVALSSFLFLLYAAHSSVGCSILRRSPECTRTLSARQRHARLGCSLALSPPCLASHPSLSPSIPSPATTSVCLYATEVWATVAAFGKESTPPSLPALSLSRPHLHASRDDDDDMTSTR